LSRFARIRADGIFGNDRLNVAQLSPLREIAELWESIARSYQILIDHEEAQIERTALGS
jgi:hypothetical protein